MGGGQAKGKESQKRGVKAPPTTIYFQIVPGVEDYWLQTWILLTYGFLGSFSVLITVCS